MIKYGVFMKRETPYTELHKERMFPKIPWYHYFFHSISVSSFLN